MPDNPDGRADRADYLDEPVKPFVLGSSLAEALKFDVINDALGDSDGVGGLHGTVDEADLDDPWDDGPLG